MRPLIGVLPAIGENGISSIRRNYIKAIEQSGGMAIVLPYTDNEEAIEQFVNLCSGFCFSGGADVDPAKYGEEKKPTCGEVVQARDAMDFAVFSKAFPTGKPILGICRGCQVINVALGGTLHQDVPSEIGKELVHYQGEPYSAPSHEVRIEADTPLSRLLQEDKIPVNSLHHQSIKTLGKGLSLMATADDGVIEAAYMPDRKYLRAIQWHPERSFDADERSRKIFREFVEACTEQ